MEVVCVRIVGTTRQASTVTSACQGITSRMELQERASTCVSVASVICITILTSVKMTLAAVSVARSTLDFIATGLEVFSL